MKKRLLAAALAVATVSQTTVIAACKENTPPDNTENPPAEITQTMPDFDYSTYDNISFSNYSENGTVPCEKLPEQYDERGTADPYVFRFNGMYYLYGTTQSSTPEMRAWKSRDLLNWEKCTGEGLQEGQVSVASCLAHAYAPEVYYFNGTFYMYTSPAGNGHYVLSADSPEGPFVQCTGNIGMSIDGSVFIDDDEKMYFMNASGAGIQIHRMNAMDDISPSSTTLSNTDMSNSVQHWTEGPMIIKRNGTYFLTYTGVHYYSDGYRVTYNTESDGNPLVSSNAFATRPDDHLLLAVDGVYKGLGHSSTVLGPDMDSYYLVYHNMNRITPNSSWRSMNIDRLLFNGAIMSVDGASEGGVAPAMPQFYADGTQGFDTGAKTLTQKVTGGVFTAEYNFKGDRVECIAGYTDENNYAYVRADYQNHSLALYSVKDGKTVKAGEGLLAHDFDPEVIHTVRVSYADGKADVYFDNMCKINSAEIKINAGKIGYNGGEIFFTAFSNTARGYSDRYELKQSGAEIGAGTYLPENAYKGLTSYKLTGSSKLKEFESELPADGRFDGAYALKLAEEGDYARYSTYFRQSGKYSLVMTYLAKYGGKRIGLQLDWGDVKTITLPEVDAPDCDVVTAVISDGIQVNKGARLVSLHATANDVEFISFSFRKTGGSTESVLDSYTAASGGRSIKYIGDGVYADCVIEGELTVNSSSGGAGFILRADNFANSQFDDDTSVRGYYVGFSGKILSLHKYNYEYSVKNIEQINYFDLPTTKFTLRVEVKGNTLAAYVNGEIAFEYTDAHAIPCGKAALYGTGASVQFTNVTVSSAK